MCVWVVGACLCAAHSAYLYVRPSLSACMYVIMHMPRIAAWPICLYKEQAVCVYMCVCMWVCYIPPRYAPQCIRDAVCLCACVCACVCVCVCVCHKPPGMHPNVLEVSWDLTVDLKRDPPWLRAYLPVAPGLDLDTTQHEDAAEV